MYCLWRNVRIILLLRVYFYEVSHFYNFDIIDGGFFLKECLFLLIDFS